MEQEPRSQKPIGSITYYLWLLPVSIGLAVGAGIEEALDRIGACIEIGLAVGVVVGLAFYRWFKSNSSDD